MTVPNRYPLPNLRNIIESLAGNKVFGKIDLKKGYYQIGLSPESIPYTAFATTDGLFEFVVLPFGLRNGPSHFQMVMNDALYDLLGSCCYCYLDDIVIFGKSEQEFLVNLERVLKRLMDLNLKANKEKCLFGVSELSYLGHTISSEGISMSSERKLAVSNLLAPNTRKQLLSFLGLANYFRDFIDHFADMVAPLLRLTKPSVPFKWTDDDQSAFDLIKGAIVDSTHLHYLDYSLPIYLRTDASDVGVGGVLFQIDPDSGSRKVVTYISKAFNSVERNWSVIEKETFSAYFCVLKCECYLLGHHFILQVDHRNMLYLARAQAPKLVRWHLRMQEYDYSIGHIPGRENVVADALSRLLLISGMSSPSDLLEPEVMSLAVNTIDSDPVELIGRFHNALVGHFGVNHTMKVLRENGLEWPNMLADVSSFIQTCATCQKCRASKGSYDAALKTTMVTEPFEVVAIDTIGPLPVDLYGNSFIIVVIDSFTRFIELFPAPNTTAVEAAKAMLNVFGRFGSPRGVRSDNGPQYDNKLIAEFLKLLGSKDLKTVPYRHEQNGLVERVNLGRHLRSLVFDERVDSKWSTYLPLIQRIVNSSYHSSIGTSPMRLLFGDSISCNRGLLFAFSEHGTSVVEDYISGLNDMEKHLVQVSRDFQDSVIRKYLASSPDNPDSFQVGDLVVVSYPERPPSKISVRWKGPYAIVAARSRTYSCQDPVTLRVSDYDIERLRLWKSSDSTMPLDEVRLRDDCTYVVEAILAHRGDARQPSSLYFLVKWKNFDEEADNNWEPYSNLRRNVVLQEYVRLRKLKIRGFTH